MSFFGGGTDFPEFFNNYGASVLSTTFDKYCYVTVRHLPPFFDYKSELVYSERERVDDWKEISHPAIRNAMEWKRMYDIRLTYEADLPARSGLGTSSSFAVGMLSAFSAVKGKHIDKKTLAEQAIYLERILCKEDGGWQDQIAVSYGGLNRIDFKEGDFRVKPIVIKENKKKELQENLMLFFSGYSHFSSDVQKSFVKNIDAKIIERKEIRNLVDEAENILIEKELDEFGRLLDYSWQLKRGLSNNISTDYIDNIYIRAKKAGALGGKILGAGGGGFILLYVEKDKQKNVRNALSELLEVPFTFDTNGTQIMYYSAETYTLNDEQYLYEKNLHLQNKSF